MAAVQGERQTAEPSYKQHFELLMLFLLLLCSVHFYPLIGNSIGGSIVSSVFTWKKWCHNCWLQMGYTTESSYPAHPAPPGCHSPQHAPLKPTKTLENIWRLVFAHPEGCGDLSDNLAVPVCGQSGKFGCVNVIIWPPTSDWLVPWNYLLYIHFFTSVVWKKKYLSKCNL